MGLSGFKFRNSQKIGNSEPPFVNLIVYLIIKKPKQQSLVSMAMCTYLVYEKQNKTTNKQEKINMPLGGV